MHRIRCDEIQETNDYFMQCDFLLLKFTNFQNKLRRTNAILITKIDWSKVEISQRQYIQIVN